MDSNYEVKTPDFSHLTSADFEHVYEPAEDTFLLLDSLQEEASFIQHMKWVTDVQFTMYIWNSVRQVSMITMLKIYLI